MVKKIILIFCLVLAFSVFTKGVFAQEDSVIILDEVLGSTPCDTGFTQASPIFNDITGTPLYHCIRTGICLPGIEYVQSSVLNNKTSCDVGWEEKGGFLSSQGSVSLCVFKNTESGGCSNAENSVSIVSSCGDFTKNSPDYGIDSGESVTHCYLAAGDVSSSVRCDEINGGTIESVGSGCGYDIGDGVANGGAVADGILVNGGEACPELLTCVCEVDGWNCLAGADCVLDSDAKWVSSNDFVTPLDAIGGGVEVGMVVGAHPSCRDKSFSFEVFMDTPSGGASVDSLPSGDLGTVTAVSSTWTTRYNAVDAGNLGELKYYFVVSSDDNSLPDVRSNFLTVGAGGANYGCVLSDPKWLSNNGDAPTQPVYATSDLEAGDSLLLSIKASEECNIEDISFDIYESDLIWDDLVAKKEGGDVIYEWPVEWCDSCGEGELEYYFIAKVGDTGITSGQSSIINVIQAPSSVCGNDRIEGGEECDGGTGCNSLCVLGDEAYCLQNPRWTIDGETIQTPVIGNQDNVAGTEVKLFAQARPTCIDEAKAKNVEFDIFEDIGGGYSNTLITTLEGSWRTTNTIVSWTPSWRKDDEIGPEIKYYFTAHLVSGDVGVNSTDLSVIGKCDSNTLALCIDATSCKAANGFWYSEQGNPKSCHDVKKEGDGWFGNLLACGGSAVGSIVIPHSAAVLGPMALQSCGKLFSGGSGDGFSIS